MRQHGPLLPLLSSPPPLLLCRPLSLFIMLSETVSEWLDRLPCLAPTLSSLRAILLCDPVWLACLLPVHSPHTSSILSSSVTLILPTVLPGTLSDALDCLPCLVLTISSLSAHFSVTLSDLLACCRFLLFILYSLPLSSSSSPPCLHKRQVTKPLDCLPCLMLILSSFHVILPCNPA